MDLFGLGSKRTSETGVWTEDSDANTCFICACGFGLITRRHHCRQCGQVVCDPCSQNRKMLESSRTGQLKRVCLRCWDGTQSAAARRLAAEERAQGGPSGMGGGGGGGSSSSPRAPVPVARLPDVPEKEAVAALGEITFEGPWEFTFLFTQVDLGPTGGGAAAPLPSSTAAMLGSGGFANKAGLGAPKKVDRSVRENSKVTLNMELKTKGAAYFQGEVSQEFAVFGSEGKITGALQRGTGKVSTTMQMISRNGSQAVTTSFNLVGVVNKDHVYSGTFTACEISKNAGSCSGLFKGKRMAPPAPDSDEEGGAAAAAPVAASGGAAGAASPSAAAAAGGSKKPVDSDEEEEEAARKKAAAKAEAKRKAAEEAEAAAAAAASAASAEAAGGSTEADEAAAKAKRKEEKRAAKQKAAEEEAAAEAAAAAAAEEAEAAAAAEAKAARKAAKAAAKAAAAAAEE